jgi:hopanoid biosynthesis associated protein HpnK
MRASRLVVNADDFGGSVAINRAVIQAHCEGILTSASLMVNGAAAADAVALARRHPGLGVGLHLTLVRGQAALGVEELRGLVDDRGRFGERPVWAGLHYFFRRRCHGLLEREVEAQFQKFRATGLVLDHVNGHLHFHMHPTILRILLRRRDEWGIRAMRMTRDPLWLNLKLTGGRYGYRLSHALVFGALAGWVEPQLRKQNIRFTQRVFGLLQNGRVDRGYVERLIQRLPPGDSELYAHPALEESGDELAALGTPAARSAVQQRGVLLVRYQDL